MNWQTVYDISTHDATEFIGFVYAGLALLAIAACFHFWARRRGQRSGTARIIAVFALVVGVLGYGVNTWDQGRLSDKLASGEILQVSGPLSGHALWRQDVTDIRRDSSRRYRQWESVTVDGVRFLWSPGAEAPAFTNALSPPIAFHDGMPVRISYVEDVAGDDQQRRILRLEIGDGGSTAASPTTTRSDVERPLPNAPFPSVAPDDQLE